MKNLVPFIFLFSSVCYPQEKKILSIAHRGASGTAPENTLASFKKALELKADYIELDVRQTKDSALVVIHDSKVNRTTNGKGRVKNFSLEEIKKLNASKKFVEKFPDEKIPTLEEVVQLVSGKSILFIELKDNDIEKTTIDLIHKYDAYSWCYIQGVPDKTLKKIIALDTSVTFFKSLGIFSRNIDFLNAKGFTVYYKFLSKKLVKKIHNKGKIVFCWTVNNEKKISKAISIGVDGVITNFPEKVRN